MTTKSLIMIPLLLLLAEISETTTIPPLTPLTVTCDSSEECKDTTIYCPTEADCTVQCSAYGSCRTATIICPTDADCTVDCTHDYSCYRTQITRHTNTLVQPTLTCNGSNACNGVTFPIPLSDIPMTVTCDDSEVCEDATIYCPAGAGCTVRCLADGACWRANIICPTDADCVIDCASDYYSTKHLSFYGVIIYLEQCIPLIFKPREGTSP
eukprot:188980_1